MSTKGGLAVNKVFAPRDPETGQTYIDVYKGVTKDATPCIQMQFPSSSSNLVISKPDDGVIELNAPLTNTHYDIASTGSNLTLDKSTTYLMATERMLINVGLSPTTVTYDSNTHVNGPGRVSADTNGNIYIIQDGAVIYDLDGVPSALSSPNGARKKLVKYSSVGKAIYAIPFDYASNAHTYTETYSLILSTATGNQILILNYLYPAWSGQPVKNADGTPSGYFYPATTTNHAPIFIIMYNADDGRVLWVNTVEGINNMTYDTRQENDTIPARVASILPDGSMILALCGQINGGEEVLLKKQDGSVAFSIPGSTANRAPSPLVIKYNAIGDPVWYMYVAELNAMIRSVAVDADGNSYITSQIWTTKDTALPETSLSLGTNSDGKSYVFTLSALGKLVSLYQFQPSTVYIDDIKFIEALSIQKHCIVGKYKTSATPINVPNMDGTPSSVALPATIANFTQFLVMYDAQGTALWAITAPFLKASITKHGVFAVMSSIGADTYSDPNNVVTTTTPFAISNVSLPQGIPGQVQHYAQASFDIDTGVMLSYSYLPHQVNYAALPIYVPQIDAYYLPLEVQPSSTGALTFQHFTPPYESVEVDSIQVQGTTFSSLIVNYQKFAPVSKYELELPAQFHDGYLKTLVNPTDHATVVESIAGALHVPPKSAAAIAYNATLGQWIPLHTGHLLDKAVTSAKLSDNIEVGHLTIANSVAPKQTGQVSLGDSTHRFKDAFFNGTIYSTLATSSDARLKTDLMQIKGALTKVNQLVGYTYTMSGDAQYMQGSGRQAGLLAQDVQQVLPEAVQPIGDSDYLSVNYSSMMSLVVEAIKELATKVQALETRLA